VILLSPVPTSTVLILALNFPYFVVIGILHLPPCDYVPADARVGERREYCMIE
jgi:hypothetical protein